MNTVNAVSLESRDRLTSNDVNAIHDTAGDGLPSFSSLHRCLEIEMLRNASTSGTVHSNSVDLENKN